MQKNDDDNFDGVFTAKFRFLDAPDGEQIEIIPDVKLLNNELYSSITPDMFLTAIAAMIVDMINKSDSSHHLKKECFAKITQAIDFVSSLKGDKTCH